MTYHEEGLAEKLAYEFNRGKDTYDLATIYAIPEHQVSRLLHWERCQRKGLPQ